MECGAEVGCAVKTIGWVVDNACAMAEDACQVNLGAGDLDGLAACTAAGVDCEYVESTQTCRIAASKMALCSTAEGNGGRVACEAINGGACNYIASRSVGDEVKPMVCPEGFFCEGGVYSYSCDMSSRAGMGWRGGDDVGGVGGKEGRRGGSS